MTGFHVDPEAIERHATSVDSVAQNVATGAAAEVIGTGQADFGVLIGHTLGHGLTMVSDLFSTALSATSTALATTAELLRSTAGTYRDAEDASRTESLAAGESQ